MRILEASTLRAAQALRRTPRVAAERDVVGEIPLPRRSSAPCVFRTGRSSDQPRSGEAVAHIRSRCRSSATRQRPRPGSGPVPGPPSAGRGQWRKPRIRPRVARQARAERVPIRLGMRPSTFAAPSKICPPMTPTPTMTNTQHEHGYARPQLRPTGTDTFLVSQPARYPPPCSHVRGRATLPSDQRLGTICPDSDVTTAHRAIESSRLPNCA